MIQVIHRALDIMELIAKDSDREKSLTEIADGLGLNHGTCANILKTLVSRKYVEQAGPKKGYRLGSMAYALTGNASYKRDLVQAARPVMEELTRALNENTLLAVLKEEKRLLLFDVRSDQDLQVRTTAEKHVFDAATGRLLLAFLSPAERQNFVRKYGLPAESVWKEAATPEGFQATLDKIREEEMAIQVTAKQIVGIAVPVRKGEQVVATLGLFLPETRFKGAWRKEIVAQLKKAAAGINQNITRNSIK